MSERLELLLFIVDAAASCSVGLGDGWVLTPSTPHGVEHLGLLVYLLLLLIHRVEGLRLSLSSGWLLLLLPIVKPPTVVQTLKSI